MTSYAIRDRRYRYIERIQKDYRAGEIYGSTVARELYDYEQDPNETRNLVDDLASIDPASIDKAGEMESLFRLHVGIRETANH